MNQFIKYESDLCDDCYKCLRNCPTKAIMIKKDERKIVEELCIKCGTCKKTCPKDAIQIKNDRHFIEKFFRNNDKVAVSLAPAFAGVKAFENHKKLVKALRLLGFDYIEETSVGAEYISEIYEKNIASMTSKNIITTACPASNFYIEKSYPEVIDSMLKIVSPMIYHGRLMKEKYGSDTKVVFIGPCLAKKAESIEMGNAVDAVITFNELIEWYTEEAINLIDLPESEFDDYGTKRGASFPVGGTLYKKDMKNPINKNYEFLRVTGIDRCQEILEAIKNNAISGYVLEINICEGSCINGPDYPRENQNFFESMDLIKSYIKMQSIKIQKKDYFIDYKRNFQNKKKHFKMPNEEEIQEILQSIGKYDEHDQLDCGACGYLNCREKAISIYNQMSDPNMCLPYLRDKAESFQNVFFEHSPNLLCLVNEAYEIVDYNKSFGQQFGYQNINLKRFPISAFFDEDVIKDFLNSNKEIYKDKIALGAYGKKFHMTLVYVEEIEIVVMILMDITLEEQWKKEKRKMKKDTIDTCQKVISEQMRVAQEIASLLGETTATTKVNLNKLKELVLKESDQGI